MRLETFISREQIQKRVSELGEEIGKDFEPDRPLIVISILSGSFLFTADLIREINISKINVQFIKLSSYEGGTTSTGKVLKEFDLGFDIEGKNVLIVEDIVDTGLTFSYLIEDLKKRNPAKMRFASLLHKEECTKHPVKIDYMGFCIENKFVVGYGLDYEGHYRNLPYIGVLEHD